MSELCAIKLGCVLRRVYFVVPSPATYSITKSKQASALRDMRKAEAQRQPGLSGMINRRKWPHPD
jgi:hypothetical protein